MDNPEERIFLQAAIGSDRLTETRVAEARTIQQQERMQGREMPPIQKVLLDRGWMTAEQVSEVMAQIRDGSQKTGRIEGYKLISRIAQGGMGAVYKAVREETDEVVALKILPWRLAKKPELVERFQSEFRAVSKIKSDHIVRVVDSGFSGGYYYYAMKFVEGESVDTTLSIDGAMSEARAVGIVHQIALALRDAERAGMIHRDIKPGNILVGDDGVAKLTDFGLAHEVDEEPGSPQGMTFGTPTYMSPEQARGNAIDIRSDIYSLGVTFYYMVTGTVPFRGDNSQLTMLKHLNEKPVAPISRRSDLSRGCNDVILKMLEKNREDRYLHARDLIRDLECLMEGKEPVFAEPRDVPEQPAPKGSSALVDKFGEEVSAGRRLRSVKIAMVVIGAIFATAALYLLLVH